MAATLHPDRTLEDIRDVEAFSATVVRRSLAKRMLPEEIEEAIAEGVALLYELHAEWDQAKTPSFATWCGTMLYFRLVSWWRREMRQRVLARSNDVNNSSYTYLGRVSLDEREQWAANANTTFEPGIGGGENHGRTDSALISHDAGRVGE